MDVIVLDGLLTKIFGSVKSVGEYQIIPLALIIA